MTRSLACGGDRVEPDETVKAGGGPRKHPADAEGEKAAIADFFPAVISLDCGQIRIRVDAPVMDVNCNDTLRGTSLNLKKMLDYFGFCINTHVMRQCVKHEESVT